jgi:hypothetical protein
VRTEGDHAPTLLFRGETTPSSVQENPVCDGIESGARLVQEIELDVGKIPRDLRVWAVARSPIGIDAAGECKSAGSDRPVTILLSQVSEEVHLAVYGVDISGEPGGQIGPYVLGITEDLNERPTEAPAERTPLGPRDVAVRWIVAHKPCARADARDNMYTCLSGSLQLTGAVRRLIRLPYDIEGQSGCWPSGVGIYCGGASGATTYDFSAEADGTVILTKHAHTDGYCETPEECEIETRQYLRFKLPKGSLLRPDPRGTFPDPATLGAP